MLFCIYFDVLNIVKCCCCVNLLGDMSKISVINRLIAEQYYWPNNLLALASCNNNSCTFAFCNLENYKLKFK